MDSDQGKLLFGVEVEFGFTVSDDEDSPLAAEDALNLYVGLCAEKLVHLPNPDGSRMYLANDLDATANSRSIAVRASGKAPAPLASA